MLDGWEVRLYAIIPSFRHLWIVLGKLDVVHTKHLNQQVQGYCWWSSTFIKNTIVCMCVCVLGVGDNDYIEFI